MPCYRGIEQSEVLKSIKAGLALLDKYSVGAECKKRINEIELETLAHAKTDADLVQAVGKCGAVYLFNRLCEVMQYHALNNTDNTGLQVFDSLSAWGAFGGAMTMEYNKLDGEQQCWLLCQYARKIADGASPSLQDKFKLVAAGIFDEEIRATKKLLAKAVRLAKQDSTDRSVAQYFNTLDLHERYLLQKIAPIMAGMNVEKLPRKSPMGRYGVVIDGLGTTLNWRDPSLTSVREAVEKALDPFYTLDEVSMTGVGLILDGMGKNDPQGIMFVSSRRAAEAVAIALSGYKVIDSKGNPILPPQQPKTRAPKKPKRGLK